MKERLLIGLGVIIFLGICGYGLYYMETTEEYFYTQIDNTKIEKVKNGDLKYEYTLNSYNDKGKKKSISFKVDRELKEDAFIKLRVLPISGVNRWEEIDFDELPDKVKPYYNEQ